MVSTRVDGMPALAQLVQSIQPCHAPRYIISCCSAPTVSSIVSPVKEHTLSAPAVQVTCSNTAHVNPTGSAVCQRQLQPSSQLRVSAWPHMKAIPLVMQSTRIA